MPSLAARSQNVSDANHTAFAKGVKQCPFICGRSAVDNAAHSYCNAR